MLQTWTIFQSVGAASEIATLDAQIEAQRHAATTERDRIRLEQQAERERTERQQKERLALIERIEKKLADRERAAADLADMLPQLNKHFRRLLELGRRLMRHGHGREAIGSRSCCRAKRSGLQSSMSSTA